MKRILTPLLGVLLVGTAPRPAFGNAGPDYSVFIVPWVFLCMIIMLLTLAGCDPRADGGRASSWPKS